MDKLSINCLAGFLPSTALVCIGVERTWEMVGACEKTSRIDFDFDLIDTASLRTLREHGYLLSGFLWLHVFACSLSFEKPKRRHVFGEQKIEGFENDRVYLYVLQNINFP